MTTVDLNQLASQCAQATDIQQSVDNAHAVERAAAVIALKAIIDKVKPGLRSIAKQIKTSERVYWIGNTYTDSKEKFHAMRGIYLGEGKPGPVRKSSGDQNRGGHSGADTFLLTDGTLLEVQYDGRWSNWQGEDSEFTSTQEFLTVEEAIASDQSDIQPENVAKLLADLFSRVINGNGPDRSKAATERAERLTAIAKLM